MEKNIWELIQKGDAGGLSDLLSKEPNLLEEKDSRGFTPLILSTYNAQQEVAELLLDLGADIDGRDVAGNTALMGTCFKGNVDIIEMLISRGADVDAKNKRGDTALTFAKMSGNAVLVALLEP